MKKILVFILTLAVSFLFVSCNKAGEKTETVDAENSVIENIDTSCSWESLSFLPLEFSYSSGVGGWTSTITLRNDGTFTGEYYDSDMGVSGKGYPNGTVYTCNFSGKFKNLKKVNDYTYSMTLSELNTREELGNERIEDGVMYISSEPFGIYGGEEFLIYTPEATVKDLPEEFLNWWPLRFEDSHETLSCYGIYNEAECAGFFSFEQN